MAWMARFRDRSHVDISFYRLYSKAPLPFYPSSSNIHVFDQKSFWEIGCSMFIGLLVIGYS